MLKICLFAFVVLIGSVKLDSIPFMDCGSGDNLLDVDIIGCSRLPCPVKMGGEHSIKISLISKMPSKHLNQNVELIVRAIHTRIQVTPDDPCHEINCPVSLNRNASLNAIMHIPKTGLVPLDAILVWKIHNDAGDQVVCMETEVTIEKSKMEYELD
ncbi:PREDICTED: uncharacterized protein LOC108558738 [Nicrophorus vespilloides]|uniref:Uncharacterized protein LOC108558738 n=1 Tax=Nicrophorus vespilloides TaxID=110193 RepID=A0ABM1M9I9_NICVS|nr:PREDICTED: uncharacterized protein LOC108558738 [Nicrophorus vespilloides]